MSKIALISGYYGFSNPGDDAILANLLRFLEENKIEPVVLYNTKKYFKKGNVHYIPRDSLSYIFSWMRRASFLISGGGGLFQDNTSFKSFLYYSFIVIAAYFFRLKVFIYGQSFGPIKKKASLKLLQIILNISNSIFVRDSYSLRLLYLLGVNKKAYFLPDIVYLKDISVEINAYPDKKEFKILLFPREKENIKELINSLRKILEDFYVKLIILPMHYDVDRKIAERIYHQLKNKERVEFIDKKLSEKEILKNIEKVNCVVSYRFHGLLFSHLLKKPFLGISDDPKLVSFLLDLKREVISKGESFKILSHWIFKLYTTRKRDLLLRDSAILRRKVANKINKEFIRSIV